MKTSASLISASLLALSLSLVTPAFAETTLVPPTAATLRPFAVSPDGWTLSGETDRISWGLSVDPATAAAPSEMVLGLETAVSVMPEASRLVVQVNGRDIGLIQLGGSSRPVTVPLPAGTLAAGWNKITLAATQRHRVDCTLAGTYELWTRIDPARSGFRSLSAAMPTNGLGLLSAASPDSYGGLRIRLRQAKLNPETLSAGFAAVGAIARLTGNQHPIVDVDRTEGVGAGVDIAVGTREDLISIGLPPAVVAAAATMPQILPPNPGGRPTLVLVAGIRGYSEALAGLATLVDGNQAPRNQPSVSGMQPETVSFADASIASSQFNGRAWQEEFNVSLPADALIADYDAVTMTLDAGYAPGLLPENRLSVFVDDRLAATVKLGNPGGDFLQNRQIEVPLSAFHPGDNHIRLEAYIGAPEDADCSANVQIEGAPRFLALDTTRFTFPRLARMAHLPDLGATIALGQSGADGEAPVNIAVAKLDDATIGAAATLYARMAIVARVQPRVTVFETAAMPSTGDMIVVGLANDLPSSIIRTVGIDAASLRGVSAMPIALIGNADPITTGSLSASSIAMVVPAALKQEDLRDAWRSRLKVDDSWMSQIQSGFEDFLAGLGTAVGFAAAEDDLLIDPSTRLVMAQAEGNGGLVTLVTASTGVDLVAGVADLTTPDAWRRIDGRATLLDSRTGEVNSVSTRNTHFVATGPLEFGNMRLVTAAWLSQNRIAYGGLLVMAAIGFGLMTWHRVRRAGVRTAP